MRYLKELVSLKKDKKIFCNLVMDEMYIKKDVFFDGLVSNSNFLKSGSCFYDYPDSDSFSNSYSFFLIYFFYGSLTLYVVF